MAGLRELTSLAELADLVRERRKLFVRWAPVPVEPDEGSRDELTGVALPGLSVNPLDPEPWWRDMPMTLWVARRLYDYCHLRHDRPRGTRAWVLTGSEVGRGPDNEPLLTDPVPVAHIAEHVLEEAQALLQDHARRDAQWGPLRRPADLCQEGGQ